MDKIFVTTFNRKIYDNYGGKKFIDSYISSKQKIPLYIFVEGDLKVYTKDWPKHEKIAYINLLEEDGGFAIFLKKYAHLQNSEPNKTEEKSEEFFGDAVRFSYKVFAQNAARKYGDKIYWIDSDCIFIKRIETEWFDTCLPDDIFVSFYNRPLQYTEAGFIAFNNKKNVSEIFFNYYINLYLSDEIWNMNPRTDCHAFDKTRNKIGNQINKKNDYKEKYLGDGKPGHIMARDSFLNPYIDHRKGSRKFKIHSPEWERNTGLNVFSG